MTAHDYEDRQRKPLTALEWLRVTHADTLSGRRIEEAVAAARAEGAAFVVTAMHALAEECDQATVPPVVNEFDRGLTAGYARAAERIRAALDES